MAETSPPEEAFPVVGLVMTGTERSDQDWLAQYLDLHLPARVTREHARRLGMKLMTTGVFRDVKVAFEPHSGAPEESSPARDLHIHVEEKWTTIPVLRAVYGGGTPLRVVGLYDTHVLGRLWTLGGEMRQYGTSPPGFVLYGRDPRAAGGTAYLGGEVWREFRNRQIFDREGTIRGHLLSHTSLVRLRILQPLASGPGRGAGAWRYGLDAEFVREATPRFMSKQPLPGEAASAPAVGAPTAFKIPLRDWTLGRLLPSFVYDDIDVDLMALDGVRMKGRVGPILGAGSPHGLLEAEVFGYTLLGYDLNLAAHAFAGLSTLNTYQARYFLGGLESIRGLPDGYLQGTRAVYASIEVRRILLRLPRLWIQSVLFTDAGAAGDPGSDSLFGSKASAGAGVRFSIPQVNRMVFRLDYAWSLDGSGLKGLTAGMGQFFDPYTPL